MTPARFGMVADDVTGACDAGVQFAECGFSSFVWLNPNVDASRCAEMVIIPTNSRNDSPETARRKVAASCTTLMQSGAGIVYKKIDSTLRGQVAPELEAVMRTCGFREAFVAPAFPAMGRTVEDGWLHVNGTRTSVHIPAMIRPVASARAFDATSQRDLLHVVELALERRPRALLVGSAGMAIELAKVLACEAGKNAPDRSEPAAERAGSVVFLIGSVHPATLGQLDALRENGASEGPNEAKSALEQGRHLIVRVTWDQAELQAVIRAIKGCPPRGLVFSGGDTARLVCFHLRAAGIRLERELMPGIPAGVLAGGVLHGIRVATKSGGFGDRRALLSVAERL